MNPKQQKFSKIKKLFLRKKTKKEENSIPKESQLTKGSIVKDPFSEIRKPLTEKELRNPAVGRMLLQQRDQLFEEKTNLESYREAYHTADKQAKVYQTVIEGQSKFTLLYTVTTTIGGALIGSSLLMEGNNFWLVLGIGIILVLITIITYFFKK